MLPKGSFKRFAAIGLAAAAVAPAGAAASPAVDAGAAPAHQHVVGQAIAAGGGPGLASTQDLRAPDQVGGGLAAAGQDLRAPDQILTASTRGTVERAAATSSDGIDAGVWIGLGALAVAGLLGLGLVLVRARTRDDRSRAVA